jgi:hypothetical protein
MFLGAGRSLLRAEGFYCSLYVFYGGLGISKLQLLNQKFKFFSAVNCFKLLALKPWIRIRVGIQPKMLDPDPESNEPDTKH